MTRDDERREQEKRRWPIGMPIAIERVWIGASPPTAWLKIAANGERRDRPRHPARDAEAAQHSRPPSIAIAAPRKKPIDRGGERRPRPAGREQDREQDRGRAVAHDRADAPAEALRHVAEMRSPRRPAIRGPSQRPANSRAIERERRSAPAAIAGFDRSALPGEIYVLASQATEPFISRAPQEAREPGVEIGDQVVRILEPDLQPHQRPPASRHVVALR